MKKTLLRCAFVAALAVRPVLAVGPAFAGELKLTMQNGRVTIIADNVPAAADPAGVGARRPDDRSSTPTR